MVYSHGPMAQITSKSCPAPPSSPDHHDTTLIYNSMSAAPPPAKLTKKQLKALAHHKSASGVPVVSTATAEETGDGDATTPTLAARGKKTKNKRKIARDEKAGDDVIGDEEDEVMGEEAEEERQAKRKQKQEKAKAAPVKKGEGEVDENEGKEGAAANAKPKTKARYIIFVGKS